MTPFNVSVRLGYGQTGATYRVPRFSITVFVYFCGFNQLEFAKQ